MVEKTAQRNRFNWHLPLYAAVGAFIVFLPFTIFAYDIGEILYIFVAAPIISLTLLVIALVLAVRKKRRQSLSALSMLAVYCVVTSGLLIKSYDIRTAGRWLLGSKGYKAEILAEPNPVSGELKHIEWDGWGWGGNDTFVYLVFDPNNSLSTAAKSHSNGKFSGIPCGVSRIRRLESQWYSVVFYTDTAWGQCS